MDDERYIPCNLADCEDPENYEPGGYHPVHLGDRYDHGRYHVIHKLGFGGFSTVWLARDTRAKRWVALKIVAARDSRTYEARSTIAQHPELASAGWLAVPERRFSIKGPNGSHLCQVLPVLGANLSQLSKFLEMRLKPNVARQLSLQATRALAALHAAGFCHGDLTAGNMAVRLIPQFQQMDESQLLRLFGKPQTDPLRTTSERSARPHGPDYIVAPIDFWSSRINVLSTEICIIDFDQSFAIRTPPSEPPGTPAKYRAPELVVGQGTGRAADIWSLGCAIFRIRTGEDLFSTSSTESPLDVLQEMVTTLGSLPRNLKETKFDEDGCPVAKGDKGTPFEDYGVRQLLKERVRSIKDEPAGTFVSSHGEKLHPSTLPRRTSSPIYPERKPLPAAAGSMVWKPTAVCVAGEYLFGYSDESDRLLQAFPNISRTEASLFFDLLSKIFQYDPSKRPSARELLRHRWFA